MTFAGELLPTQKEQNISPARAPVPMQAPLLARFMAGRFLIIALKNASAKGQTSALRSLMRKYVIYFTPQIHWLEINFENKKVSDFETPAGRAKFRECGTRNRTPHVGCRQQLYMLETRVCVIHNAKAHHNFAARRDCIFLALARDVISSRADAKFVV